jgi:predicted permease
VREPDLDEEVAAHVELLAARYRARGMTPAQAEAAARRQFGNLTLQQQDRRELRRFAPVERLLRSGRDALRQLRRSPGFTAAAVLALALGIGVSSAMFTLLDQLVVRALPVADARRLVMIWSTGPNLGDTRGPMASSFPLCQQYQREARALDAVFCRAVIDAALTTDATDAAAGADPVRAELVSGNYFEALRIGPAVGRVFSAAADDRVDRGHPVVVLGHRYWRDRFGGDARIVGRTVRVNGQPMEVVGVAAAGFTGVDAAQATHVWLSVRMKALVAIEDGLTDPQYEFLQIFGRLAPGQTVDSARDSLQVLFRRALDQQAARPNVVRASAFDRQRFLERRVLVESAPGGYSELRRQFGTPLLVLMAMAATILLVACSNVAGLLVARGVARQRELGVRLAIGAGRGALVAQLLVESLLLGVAGSVLGLVLSTLVTRSLLAMLPASDAVLLLRAEPDARILLFGAAMSLVTTLAFGLLPALQATRIDPTTVLRSATGAVGGARSATRLRRVLVVAQVTLSFLLLVGAGLFSRTLANLRGVDTGVDAADRLVTFQLNPAQIGYSMARSRQFYADVQAALEAAPGVDAAAYAWMPLLQGWAPTWAMRIEGYTATEGDDLQVANNIVSPGFFRAVGVRLVEGRLLDERDRFPLTDTGRMPTVAVVNQQFAKRFVGDGRVIGRRFGIGEDKDALGIEIVGVVADAVAAGPRRGAEPQVFFSFLQANFPIEATFYVRSRLPPDAIVGTIRRIVGERDGALPIRNLKTVARQLDDTLSAERLIASLSAAFGVIPTMLAALGLYGVTSFSVARRTREIGLRTALGASTPTVVWLVLREVMVMLGVGVAIALPCAVALARYTASQFFGVTSADAVSLASAGVTLTVAALAAGWLPARRASRIAPLVALRQD